MPFAETRIYSVAEIVGEVRQVMEKGYASVAVTGEISNLRRASSGHLYFTLKDEAAQLSVVCFRSAAARTALELADGLQVVARGRLTVYEAQGRFQMVAEALEEAGLGALEQRFRELVSRLAAEGLFEEAAKRALPSYPGRVAVVTSPTGAAVRDIVSTLRRRWPCADILLAPVPVQGAAAAPAIVAALEALSVARAADVVILGRGGGSIEDLWAFNEEAVARAIRRCAIPVVSAVGHETDVTIADFAADHRAATPTAAAELVAPVRGEVERAVAGLEGRLQGRTASALALWRERLERLLESYALGEVRGRIERGLQRLDHVAERLAREVASLVRGRSGTLEARLAALAALDPRAILERGYAICADRATGRPLRSRAEALAAGRLRVTFRDGDVPARVEEGSA
jgi:exodeoxyribonuclease VII large subunit